jgi:hypothetical protein
VSPNRFQLEGTSLDELNARVLEEHGPHARVVAVRAVTTGGIQGFFAQRRFQIDVDVPDGTARDVHAFDLPTRAGIALLLDDADSVEARIRAADTLPDVSTSSESFDTLMADLTLNTAPPTPSLPIVTARAPRLQAPLSAPGDLVIVVGLGSDALTIAREMTIASGTAELRVAGECSSDGVKRVSDRRGVLAARAQGVRDQFGIIVALGLQRVGLDEAGADALEFLQGDQVWVAVDAGRKPADTGRWVAAVAAISHVDAVAVIGRGATSSPNTVNELGLQVGWVESGSVG